MLKAASKNSKYSRQSVSDEIYLEPIYYYLRCYVSPLSCKVERLQHGLAPETPSSLSWRRYVNVKGSLNCERTFSRTENLLQVISGVLSDIVGNFFFTLMFLLYLSSHDSEEKNTHSFK